MDFRFSDRMCKHFTTHVYACIVVLLVVHSLAFFFFFNEFKNPWLLMLDPLFLSEEKSYYI